MSHLKCHTIRGVGGAVGPDLSMIGKKASRENLLESILYPSKAVADQYINWQIETRKGQSLNGLIVEETPEYVLLRDGNGKDTKIVKKDIESRKKSPTSLMPEDIVAFMSEDELVDVTEYLLGLKTSALAVPSWSIVGPFDNGSADAGLDRDFGPEKETKEKGVDLKATYTGKTGKVGWHTVKPDGQGYVDLQAFFGGQARSRNIVSYLYREVEAPADLDAVVLIGTDDGCKLWVNDRLVFTDRRHQAAVPEANQVKVRLKKGKNKVLLKINNGDGPHGFYFTVLSEQELK
jgi:putative heme-binding domain-containing protein